MGMYITTNVAAINAQRNLNTTGLKMGKVLEKLSSGYRINRAADDAAGLGISEKMRSQIRGNAQALRNAQDGISMIQTAEGAMDEIHSILQRARELAVQAANGSMDSIARTSIGTELVALQAEIDRIAVATQFNGQQLLNGTLMGMLATSAVDPTSGAQVGNVLGATGGTATVTAIDVSAAQVGTYAIAAAAGPPPTITVGGDTVNIGADMVAGEVRAFTFSNGISITLAAGAGGKTAAGIVADIAQLGADIVVSGSATRVGTVLNGTGGDATVAQLDVTRAQAGTFAFSSAGGPGTLTLGSETIALADMGPNSVQVLNFAQTGISITLVTGPAAKTAADILADLGDFGTGITVTGSGSSVFQVGANVGNTMAVSFEDVRATSPTGLNLTAWVADTVVQDLAATDAIIKELDVAIGRLNTRRSNLGAAQNRLEHTIASLGVAVENLSAAESRIRDADIAQLSSEMVSSQILQQAGVSVLAQANQSPQAVLSLLQR